MRQILALLVGASVSFGNAQSSREPLYLADVNRAMDTMMADMNGQPTGNVDADFVAAMTPHHQGAIAMAKAELTYGQNELLRRIAQGIVVEQAQEIDAMRMALGDTSTPAAERPPETAAGAPSHGEHRDER